MRLVTGPILLKEPNSLFPWHHPRKERHDPGERPFVKLAIDIDRDGSVEKIEVEESSGYRLLDRAAVRAAKKWRFRPAVKNGKRIASRYFRVVRFKLVHG